MKRTMMPAIALLLTGLLWLALALPVSASPLNQGVTYNTPTPGADGRIIYKVQAGDTCLRIRLLTKVTTEELIKLNNLDANCTIQEGQELVIGQVTPAATAAAAQPQVTATAAPPAPTPLPGDGKVCIYLYDDVNGDALRQESETAIAGGAVSLTDRTGAVSLTGTTTAGDQAFCFDKVPEGDYNISVAIPEGYNPTTSLNYALKLQAGDLSTMDFGAQLSSQAAPVDSDAGQRSPILGILGGVLLLAGAGLGVYVKWGSRKAS